MGWILFLSATIPGPTTPGRPGQVSRLKDQIILILVLVNTKAEKLHGHFLGTSHVFLVNTEPEKNRMAI